MVDLADVRRWDATALDSVYRQLARAEQELMHVGDDLLAAGRRLEGWQGIASVAAHQEHRNLDSALDHGVAGMRLLMKTVAEAMDAIPAVQRSIAEAEELGQRYGLAIGENGEITDLEVRPGPHGPNPEDRATARETIRTTLEQVVRTATDIDNDLTRVLNQVGEGQVGTGHETTTAAAAAHGAQAQGLTLTQPPANATPAQNAAWWDTLSPNAQQLLLSNNPGLLGNRDGIPFAVRDAANRAQIPGERAKLERQLADLRRQSSEAHPPGTDNRTTAATDASIAQQFQTIQAKLDSLTAIERSLQRADHHLLTLNTGPERVEAAVAVGNVDTAKHVAVFTPGFTSTVNDSLGQYDRQMTSLVREGRNIGGLDTSDGGSVAAVTWMGYQAPQMSEIPEVAGNSVASPVAAEQGGEKLAGFLNGVDAARAGAEGVAVEPAPHITALGHSYGSTTTGYALQHDTPVDDAVLLGSPGTGALTPGDIKVPEGHLYAEWAAGDKVPYAAAAGNPLGASPYGWQSVQELSTDASVVAGEQLGASHGHSEYLNERTTSQHNLAAIVTDHPELAKR